MKAKFTKLLFQSTIIEVTLNRYWKCNAALTRSYHMMYSIVNPWREIIDRYAINHFQGIFFYWNRKAKENVKDII